MTSEDVQDSYQLIHLQTRPSLLCRRTRLRLPPPYFLHHDSLPPSLECHSSLGGFNVAFNPRCLIITLTFTLHSIKFLTADLLQ